jgi:acyl-coenzyme A thioesterase PaaI-like protein
MGEQAIQDALRSVWTVCWGCGPDNEHGLQIKSFWDGQQGLCTWQARPHHHAAPGVLNGGIIASIIDCHSIWTAIAATYQAEGRDWRSEPPIWYVTGSLHITYLRPTPIAEPVTLRAVVSELGPRKAVVQCALLSGELECARGETVAVRVAPDWLRPDHP